MQGQYVWLEACQKAFDSLSTAMIENSGVLDHLTDDNKNVAAAILTQSGITNAQELIDAGIAERNNLPKAAESAPASASVTPEDLEIQQEKEG